LQLASFAFHRPPEANPAAAFVEQFKTAFGAAPPFCTQADGTSNRELPPSPLHRCDETCPLCQLAAAVAILPPLPSGPPERLTERRIITARALDWPRPALRLSDNARPRAPPVLV